MNDNPFILEPYKSKDLFCDREKETSEIIRYLENGRNITLVSPRRLGKTGLIYRIFDELSDRKTGFDTFYTDISSSQNIDDFVKLLSESVVSTLKQKSRISNFFKLLGGIRPILSYDPLSGKPEVSITYRNEDERVFTLKSIFNYLENNNRKVIVAIDEFQQIRQYHNIDMEALLRTYIQPLHNVRFLFCGSKKHTMTDIFSNAKRPFYESTTFYSLKKLDIDIYCNFIIHKFTERGKLINQEQAKDIILWTKDHTFYTQALCNEVFIRSGSTIHDKDISEAKNVILRLNEDRFLEIQRLVTPSQWNLMKAIAKESTLKQPTAQAFLTKYGLGSGAGVLKNLKTLVEKELVLEENALEGTAYSIYNIFLFRYLEKL